MSETRESNTEDNPSVDSRPSMLQMRTVSKSFRTKTVETTALDDISLDVGVGEFVTVAGPSGSGKTTFLNIVGLLETLDSGTYELDGDDVSKLSDRQRAVRRNEKIGFVFQSFNLIPELNVYDNVDVPLRYRGFNRKDRRERIENVLARVGLETRMKHFPAQLSGGQQQRVAIARALAGEPSLLLADEPTGNLDSRMAEGVMDLLTELNDQGTTILMVTHDEELSQRGHRCIRIRDGVVQNDDESDA